MHLCYIDLLGAYRGWKRRQGKSMSDQSPTHGITCPHGGLLPELAGARARRYVRA